jgi:hypothetical protein
LRVPRLTAWATFFRSFAADFNQAFKSSDQFDASHNVQSTFNVGDQSDASITKVAENHQLRLWAANLVGFVLLASFFFFVYR